jgi:RNA polymerase sigma-70 factor (ECF subfamily)
MRFRRDRLLDELEELYRRRGGAFLRVAHGITGDPDDAAEAVQDGFADVIRSRGTFRGDGPLEAWVWRAVVNAARKAVRPAEAELPDATFGAFVPEAVAELAPLVAALPERQRLAVFLRYYADLDYRSIAHVLDVELGTVGPTLAAAHRSIRSRLEEVLTDG